VNRKVIMLAVLVVSAVSAGQAHAQSAPIQPNETGMTIGSADASTSYACVPEGTHWAQALPAGAPYSDNPNENPPSYESIPGAPLRAYQDLNIQIQAQGTNDMADLQIWQCRRIS
jgi:hypothetical protein